MRKIRKPARGDGGPKAAVGIALAPAHAWGIGAGGWAAMPSQERLYRIHEIRDYFVKNVLMMLDVYRAID